MGFLKKITLLGFSHASATSHFQWSGLSYVICSKKWTLLESVISQFFTTFFARLDIYSFHCWTTIFIVQSSEHGVASIMSARGQIYWWRTSVFVFEFFNYIIEYGVASTMSARGQTYWWRTWTRDRAGKFNQVVASTMCAHARERCHCIYVSKLMPKYATCSRRSKVSKISAVQVCTLVREHRFGHV